MQITITRGARAALAVGLAALLLPSSAHALTGGSLASADASFTGQAPNDLSATSVAGAGDVNGDGFDDLVIGAPKQDLGLGNDGGAAYIVLGGSDGWGTETRLGSSSIVRYLGDNGEEAGTSVAGAGDLNGDGFDDIVVGAPLSDLGAGTDAGAAYIVLGSAAPASDNLGVHPRLTGEVAGDKAGASVAGSGDVNGDGRDDVLVGAPVNADGGAGAGAAYLVLGSAAPASGSLAAQVEYTGAAGDAAGTSVAGGGDFDGDGLSDLIIGAPSRDTPGVDAGAAYIEPGSLAPASKSLDSGTPVVRLSGDSGDTAGTAVAMGDVNGDGYADAVVGAPLNDAGGADAGAAYVVPGRPGMPSNTLGVAGTRLIGELANDRAGTSVSAVGAVDTDSFGEFLAGAPLQGSVEKGAAYLVRGAASLSGGLASQIRHEGALNNDKGGTSVAGAGDLNGDALADFLVGAPENDITFSNGGTTYAVFAPPPDQAAPSYRTRAMLRGNTGNARPARFDLARAVVDFTAGALIDGSVDVRRYLLDPCDTGVPALRPTWKIDSNKLDTAGGSSLQLTFGYTSAEVAAAEEAGLRVLANPPGAPCGNPTAISPADTVRDTAHNRITVTLTGVTSLGWYRLDVPGPETSIDSGPTGVTNDDTPTFTFSVDDPPASTFECRVDSDSFAACTSPFTTAPLADGPHVIEVRGIAPDGTADPTPASQSFSVGATKCRSLLPTIVGTPGPDNITGTAGADVVLALDGSDRIASLAGADTLCGGEGDDSINGGDGDNTVAGGSGDDEYFGGLNGDIVRGNSGRDELHGRGGADRLYGDDGDDALFGEGSTIDRCDGGSGIDTAKTCETLVEVP